MNSLLESGNRFKKIGESINNQVQLIFKKNGFEFEQKWWNTLGIISANKSITVQQLAKKMNVSHPAVVQIINKLREQKLIISEKNRSDKRLTSISLSEKGIKVTERMKPIISESNEALEKLLLETGYDLIDVLSKTEQLVMKNGFANKVNSLNKEKQIRDVEIVTYSKKYKRHFKSLNIEWLEKYFTVEPFDKKLLSAPESEIINKGGEVFFAIVDKNVSGTCAMLKINESSFELTKMAVTESAQGKQIGKKLALTAIGFAISKNADKIVLDTNEKLSAAINLYRSLGFIVIPYNYDDKYKRKLLRMELKLNER